jgi:UDP-N-acetylmuramyl pentapeptide phosphotransferase/UDP-N-acetylglucosamine-1-phosphate transferase
MDEIGGDPGASFWAGGLPGALDNADHLLAKAAARFPEFASLISPVSARGLFLALVGLLLLLILPSLVGGLLCRWKRVEPNYRGETIPQSYGLVILLWAGALFALTAWLLPEQRSRCANWLLAVVGYGALGLADDTWGSKKFKGLRGHFRAAFRERVFTTGFLKAVGGALLALLLGWRLHPGNPPAALLAGALIALSANAVNLLDLRPGRAGAVFLVAAGLLLWVTVQADSALTGVPPLLYVVLPTLPVWERDARAAVMMGDTGSNLLGACLGLAVASLPALASQIVTLSLLIILHAVAERYSLTQIIEKTPVLRALDRLTGVR